MINVKRNSRTSDVILVLLLRNLLRSEEVKSRIGEAALYIYICIYIYIYIYIHRRPSGSARDCICAHA
jgi:hypothetical protein